MAVLYFLVTSIALLLITKFVLWWNEFKRRRAQLDKFLTGPKPLPLLGNALSIKSTSDLKPKMEEFHAKYGDTLILEMGPFLHLVSNDPKLVEVLTTSNVQITKTMTYRFMRKWLGEGLFTSGNPKWKLHRKLLTPTFHFKLLEESYPIFQKNVNNLMEYFDDHVGIDFDINASLGWCTLDVISEAAMGISINALKEGKDSKFAQYVKTMAKNFVIRTFSVWKQFDFLYQFSENYREDEEAMKYLNKISNDMIQSKKEKMKSKCETSVDEFGMKKRPAFLDLLLISSIDFGGPMTDEDIRNEVNTFLAAGQETTSSALSFTLYFLSKHQDVQQKVYDEIINIFGDKSEIEHDKLAELKYLDMVIKESLRLLPPIPVFGREITENLSFEGHIIPKGVHLNVSIYGLHRNAKYYSNPNDFIPERFSVDESSKRHNFCFIPFSAGPRNCIGQRFALTEIKCTLAMLVRKFKFLDVPNFEMQLIMEGVLKSSNGVHVRLEKR